MFHVSVSILYLFVGVGTKLVFCFLVSRIAKKNMLLLLFRLYVLAKSKYISFLAMVPDLVESEIITEEEEESDRTLWLQDHLEDINEAKALLSPKSKSLSRAVPRLPFLQ